jgi:hypothetical protein
MMLGIAIKLQRAVAAIPLPVFLSIPAAFGN